MSIASIRLRTLPVVLLGATLGSGCIAPEAHDSIALTEAASDQTRCIGCGWGPPITNTHKFGDLAVPSLRLDGATVDGVTLTDVSIVEGSTVTPLDVIEVIDGELHGADISGKAYAGAQFQGSVWTVEIDHGPTAEVLVTTISTYIQDGDRSRYVFDHGPTLSEAKESNCAEDPATGERSAILFADLAVDATTGTMTSDPGSVYIGCLSGAVGKAAYWGYVPWAHGTDMHQAATRVVRADYCGDGTPYTLTGIPLQLSDEANIQKFTEPGELTEAMWDHDGAVCMGTPRHNAYPFIICPSRIIPACKPSDTLADWTAATLWSKRWDLITPATL
ncbi:MAG: hypothetical protein K0V04_20965 [Deltaproteobacteria bacterium]|nr:hypothetical protein [Deltaproteobacteria bacterium]